MTKFQDSLKQSMSQCCLQLAKDEVELGFAVLRLNYSVEVDRIVATFQTLPFEERLRTALALATLQQERTNQEELLVKAFRDRKMGHSVAGLEGMAIHPLDLEAGRSAAFVIESDVELALLRQASSPLPKSEIRRNFLARLRKDYERKISPEGSMVFKCATPNGDWRVLTIFDFGGVFQFRVGFLLEHPKLPNSPHFGGATLGALLGHGELGWDSLTRENLERGAEAAVKLCTEIRSRLTQVTSTVEE